MSHAACHSFSEAMLVNFVHLDWHALEGLDDLPTDAESGQADLVT